MHMPVLQMEETQEEEAVVHFLGLIQTLLKDPAEREAFFLVIQYYLHVMFKLAVDTCCYSFTHCVCET